MRRRYFVVALASTASVAPTAVTGCLSSEGDDEPSDNEEDGDFSLSDLEAFSDTEVGVESRFEGEPCPDLGDELTLCYHEVGTEPPVYLEPEREVGDPSEEPIEFTVLNEGPEPIEYHSGGWDLHKKTDEGWLRILPWITTLEGPISMNSGESNAWRVSMSSIEGMGEYFSSNSTSARYTGSGTYAFSATVGVESYPDVRLVSLFEVEDGSISFEPVGIDEYERQEGVIHARTESYEENEDRFALSVTVVDDPSESELSEIHDEYAVQSNIINNTLAFFNDGNVEEIRFEGGETLLRRASLLEAFNAIHEQLEGEIVIESSEDFTVEEYQKRLRFVNDDTTYEIAPVEYEGDRGEEAEETSTRRFL